MPVPWRRSEGVGGARPIITIHTTHNTLHDDSECSLPTFCIYTGCPCSVPPFIRNPQGVLVSLRRNFTSVLILTVTQVDADLNKYDLLPRAFCPAFGGFLRGAYVIYSLHVIRQGASGSAPCEKNSECRLQVKIWSPDVAREKERSAIIIIRDRIFAPFKKLVRFFTNTIIFVTLNISLNMPHLPTSS